MNGNCEICGAPAECEHHLIFGRGMRALADEDQLILKMCNSCHNMSQLNDCKIHENPMAEKLSKMLGQVIWEKRYVEMCFTRGNVKETAHKAFMKRYGRSYIDGI